LELEQLLAIQYSVQELFHAVRQAMIGGKDIVKSFAAQLRRSSM
jgi:hypothetical protein